MRDVIVSRVLSVLLAVASIGFFANTASAATKKLAGTYSFSQVMLDCAKNDGTNTPGTGTDGYGCKTPKGEVSCTKDGKCTGTCGRCKARKVPTPRDTALTFVLRNGAAPIKAEVPVSGKPTETVQPKTSDKPQH
jgi:hypothetical protein